MALYIPHSIFDLARLLYVRPETFGPYYVPVGIYVKWIDKHEHNSQSRGFATFSVRITENRLKVDMTYGNVPEHETDEVGR